MFYYIKFGETKFALNLLPYKTYDTCPGPAMEILVLSKKESFSCWSRLNPVMYFRQMLRTKSASCNGLDGSLASAIFLLIIGYIMVVQIQIQIQMQIQIQIQTQIQTQSQKVPVVMA